MAKSNRRLTIGRPRANKRSLGQSITEFAILLPILIMMISGVIEFGFMLNYYLDLTDAAREAARFAADDDPLLREPEEDYGETDNTFYLNAQDMTLDSIDVGSAGQIQLDPNSDDIVISAFSILDGAVEYRYPSGSGEDGLSLYSNHTSAFTTADVNSMLDPAAPNTGLVLIEIYYDYHMILGLPWITAFVPDPVTLHAYCIMPNVSIEPTATPPGGG